MHFHKRLSFMLFSLLLCACLLITVNAGAVQAKLLMRLSTRTGPGTQYEEPGTYFQNNWNTTYVDVKSAAWDKINDIWWVQVEFQVNSTWYRVYTGLKRVNVDINSVLQESPLGTSYMTSAAKAYWGPGQHYAMSKFNVPMGTSVTVINAENGFVQVEFYDARTATSDRSLRRAWVNQVAVNGSWSGSYSPPSITYCPVCYHNLPHGNDFVYCPYCASYLDQ